MIRIVLLDNQKLFRVSFKSYISTFSNYQIELDIGSINEIPCNYDYNRIHLLIIDPTSIENFQKVQKDFNSSRIMILTNMIDRKAVMNYMEQGISGFFSKKDCPTQLVSSIHDISNNYNLNEVHLGAVVRQNLINGVKYLSNKQVTYSERELEVLKLVCQEKTNIEISVLLRLSVRTIESHRRRMIEKAECRTIIGVIFNAIKLDYVQVNNAS